MQDKPGITPRVSLSLPVRNGEEYLSQAIQSILDQTYADFELIITDNASTDATEDICREYASRDPRIRYVRSPRDQGAAANFNLGFSLSSGEYFKWCAHDDLISPTYIAECVEALDANRAVVLAYGDLTGIDENGDSTGYVEPHMPDLDRPSPTGRFRRLLTRHVLVAAIFGVYRRSALERTSLHKPYYSSDCALLAEIVLLGPVVRISNAILLNRDHPNRSIRLDSANRLIWQDPQASGRIPCELSKRIWHLMEIVHRRRDVEPLYKTAPALLMWACNPLLIGRLALEGIGTVSPSLRWRLRDLGLISLGALESLTASSAPENCTEDIPTAARVLPQKADRDAFPRPHTQPGLRAPLQDTGSRGRTKGG
jgi:glycosyltransferase involved in cell wall biosynthesis